LKTYEKKGQFKNKKQKDKELETTHFHNKESHSFGALTSQEWNNLFAKHLNHHLT